MNQNRNTNNHNFIRSVQTSGTSSESNQPFISNNGSAYQAHEESSFNKTQTIFKFLGVALIVIIILLCVIILSIWWLIPGLYSASIAVTTESVSKNIPTTTTQTTTISTNNSSVLIDAGLNDSFTTATSQELVDQLDIKNLNITISNNVKPWSVRIVNIFGNQTFYSCTGIIIKNNEILTAAHCLFEFEGDDENEAEKILELHILDMCENNQTCIRVIPRSEIELIPHSDNDMEEFEFKKDIGIIKLKNKIEFSEKVYPIRLPFGRDLYSNNFTMNMWTSHQLSDDWDSNEISVNLVNVNECQKLYSVKGKRDLKFYDKESKEQIIFCANSQEHLEPGNSGGVVFKQGKKSAIAYGILSFGGKKNSTLPGVFVDIRANLEWIFNNT